MSTSQRALEARARRLAARLGWRIEKSRGPLSNDNQGEYAIINDYNTFEYGGQYDLEIQEVINILEEELA